MIHAVRAVAAGEAALSPSSARRLISALPVRTPLATPGIPLNLLTARELEVLRLIAAGMANEEIAHALATANTHVSRVLTKLGARDRARLVRLTYESGLSKQDFRLPSTHATRRTRGLTTR